MSLIKNRPTANRMQTYFCTVCLLALFAITTNIQATDWSPVLVLENGDEILWKLDQVVEPKKSFLVNELRDLSKTHDGIKSFVTQFEIDCDRLRIKEISYHNYAVPPQVELLKTLRITSNTMRRTDAEGNE